MGLRWPCWRVVEAWICRLRALCLTPPYGIMPAHGRAAALLWHQGIARVCLRMIHAACLDGDIMLLLA